MHTTERSMKLNTDKQTEHGKSNVTAWLPANMPQTDHASLLLGQTDNLWVTHSLGHNSDMIGVRIYCKV